MKRTIIPNRPQGRFNFANHICMSHFINYLKDTIAELKHVSWPTNKQSLVYTALVVGLSTVIALYVGLFDFLFSKGLDWFIK
jgi:preprotein translocase SecE subunit